jgi:hypothetical protein
MLRLKFNGWFQCRLATDPDPSDELRGLSGSIKALPGEPDLDRIIRLQPPIVRRSHTPEVGVEVHQVFRDDDPAGRHPLVGAKVVLSDEPIFKGENGIVAEDGKEPIVPFAFRIANDDVVLVRSCPDTPDFTEFPYDGLQAFGIVSAPGQVADATGIHDIQQHFDDRVARLEEDKKNEKDPNLLDNIERRIALLKEVDKRGQRVAPRFFGFMLPYFVPLTAKGSVEDPNSRLGELIDLNRPWLVEFWMGGWDPDAMCAFMQGYVSIPTQ